MKPTKWNRTWACARRRLSCNKGTVFGTILSGLAAGILYKLLKGDVGIWRPTLFAFIMESVDMALLLLIARPFSDALNLVQIIDMPMIVGDTIGVAIFAFMLSGLTRYRKLS